jgi:hypothetical protein
MAAVSDDFGDVVDCAQPFWQLTINFMAAVQTIRTLLIKKMI